MQSKVFSAHAHTHKNPLNRRTSFCLVSKQRKTHVSIVTSDHASKRLQVLQGWYEGTCKARETLLQLQTIHLRDDKLELGSLGTLLWFHGLNSIVWLHACWWIWRYYCPIEVNKNGDGETESSAWISQNLWWNNEGSVITMIKAMLMDPYVRTHTDIINLAALCKLECVCVCADENCCFSLQSCHNSAALWKHWGT